MTFGEYLRKQREERGWTQPIAADKIGIEQSYLSKLETGKATPSEEMFARLVDAYDINVDALSAMLGESELMKMREIAAVRDLLQTARKATETLRRRWLVAGLALLAFGSGLLSFVITEVKYPKDQYVYVSKGVIKIGESDLVFNDVSPRGGNTITLFDNRPCLLPEEGAALQGPFKFPNGMRISDPMDVAAEKFQRCMEAGKLSVPHPLTARLDAHYMVRDSYAGDLFKVMINADAKPQTAQSFIEAPQGQGQTANAGNSAFKAQTGGEDHRRVYELQRTKPKEPTLNTHVFHALAVALIISGLASLYIARRW